MGEISQEDIMNAALAHCPMLEAGLRAEHKEDPDMAKKSFKK